VSGPVPAATTTGDSGDGESAKEAAVAGKLPVSWLPETGRAVAGGADGLAGAGGASPAAVSASPEAASPSPDAALSVDGTADAADDARLAAAARGNVQTLTRACWPGTLSPGLTSTRLRFSFVAARHTGLGVVSEADDAAQGTVARLRLWGFPAVRLALEDGGWRPPGPGPLLCYRPGLRTAALAVAGDLGLPTRSVVRIGDAPRELVLVLAE